LPAPSSDPEVEVNVRNPVIIHWVHDMDRATRFYEQLFAVETTMRTPAFSLLALGPVQLALHLLEPGAPEAPLPHAGLNLEVDDVDALLPLLDPLGGRVVRTRQATREMPFRVAMLCDADGNGFELRQRVEGAGAPPPPG
jgi:predicted enzyme related to lactoylglutathione lyase